MPYYTSCSNTAKACISVDISPTPYAPQMLFLPNIPWEASHCHDNHKMGFEGHLGARLVKVNTSLCLTGSEKLSQWVIFGNETHHLAI